MVSSNLNNIEKKKLQKEKNETKESNWFSFFLSIFRNFIFVIIFTLIGSNFIYLTSSEHLDTLFPTNISNYLNIKQIQKGGYKCPTSYTSRERGLNKDVLKSLSIGDVFGFPYSLYVNDKGGINFDSLKSWFSSTIAHSYITNRMILKKILHIFKPFDNPNERNILSSNTLQYIISVPIILLILGLTLPFGFITTLVQGFRNNITGIIWSIIGIFTGYSWIMYSSVMSIQFILNLITFLFIPFIVDHKTVFDVIKCNSKFIMMIFGLLIVISGFNNLNTTTALVMLVTYVLFVLKQLIF